MSTLEQAISELSKAHTALEAARSISTQWIPCYDNERITLKMGDALNIVNELVVELLADLGTREAK